MAKFSINNSILKYLFTFIIGIILGAYLFPKRFEGFENTPTVSNIIEYSPEESEQLMKENNLEEKIPQCKNEADGQHYNLTDECPKDSTCYKISNVRNEDGEIGTPFKLCGKNN